LVGQNCLAGLDLGSTKDLTAFVLLFGDEPSGFRLLPFFWCPRDEMMRRSNKGDELYRLASEAGLLTVTDGRTTDYGLIRETIVKLSRKYHIRGIAADRLFQGDQLVRELKDRGFNCEPWGQGFISMTAPSLMFERLLTEGKMRHNGHPLLEWMASNVGVEHDPKATSASIKPIKMSRELKIDGIVAAIMAVGLFSKSPKPVTDASALIG